MPQPRRRPRVREPRRSFESGLHPRCRGTTFDYGNNETNHQEARADHQADGQEGRKEGVEGTRGEAGQADRQAGGIAAQHAQGECDEGTSLDKIARDAEPWFIRGFVLMFLTGVPQLISNALREYYSPFFWTKTLMLALALIFTFTIRRRVVLSPNGAVSTGMRKLVGAASIVLWAGVAIPARLIGLFT